MTEAEKKQANDNRAIRGFIIRALAKGFNKRLLVRQISQMLRVKDLIISPDISEHLNYLMGDGEDDTKHRYIEPTEDAVTAYTAYADDAVFRLTRRGVDLSEGRFKDEGIEI